MYRIFLVEDDRGIAQAIRTQAERWGLSVLIAEDFRNIMAEFAAAEPHIVLLDISLPCCDGYHWCREIRKVSRVPILFLSSASDNLNIVMAMNLGADDFLAKPFDQSVLMAKLRAMLRRSYDFALTPPMPEHRGARLHPADGTLTYQGEKIELTKNEQRILLCLLERPGEVVPRETLMEKLWETDSFVDDNTLTVNVNRLRRKLGRAGFSDFISTKFGVGYFIE